MRVLKKWVDARSGSVFRITAQTVWKRRLPKCSPLNSANRLDGIIQFEPLQPATISHVVDKFLTELQAQLDDKRVTIEVDADARTWLAVHGYDIKMGARPMARLIQENLKSRWRRKSCLESSPIMAVRFVTVKDEKLSFSFVPESTAG